MELIPGLDPKFLGVVGAMALALTQVVKNAFDVPGRLAPVVALVDSILCALLLGAYLRMNPGDAAFHGFVSALLAMGAYSGYTAATRSPEDQPLRPEAPPADGGSGDS